MYTLVALILSIVLQFVAAVIALRLTKKTKYRLSWILISLGFLFMAVRRFLEFLTYVRSDYAENLNQFNSWLTVITSIVITAGVILISELFNYLGRVERIRQETQKRILDAIIKTEENERKRFAKDLHDGLGPILSSVKMSISHLAKLEENTKNKEIIINTDRAINEAIKSLKEISNNLSPHILSNFGLASAIRNFTNKLEESQTLKLEFNTNLGEKRLDENVEVVLYRVVCELVNNTLKHADAHLIRINLHKDQNKLKLEYSDDGQGFDAEKILTGKRSGMGYSNMISRIRSIKGSYEVISQVGKGVKVIISINI
ncbi:MAG: sensor histidine kinase [Bacteroidota bacterium]|nr:sensor histidine kinase [Bacteroidota bacterium]